MPFLCFGVLSSEMWGDMIEGDVIDSEGAVIEGTA